MARRRDESGFTLVELIVVILVLGILIAIAIPSFMGARTRAEDRAVQTNIRHAGVAEGAFYTGAAVFTDDPALMTAEETQITFTTAASTSSKSVSLYIADPPQAQIVVLGARSNSGDCFYMRMTQDNQPRFARGTGSCDPDASGISGWQETW